jgi:transcriptional regulator with XRE-family HTH domain
MTQPTGRQNGAAIRAFREKEGMSVPEVAGLLGMHPQSLRNIENGRRPASDEIIWHLARILVVPEAAITYRDETGNGAQDDSTDDGAPEPQAEPEDAAAALCPASRPETRSSPAPPAP